MFYWPMGQRILISSCHFHFHRVPQSERIWNNVPPGEPAARIPLQHHPGRGHQHGPRAPGPSLHQNLPLREVSWGQPARVDQSGAAGHLLRGLHPGLPAGEEVSAAWLTVEGVVRTGCPHDKHWGMLDSRFWVLKLEPLVWIPTACSRAHNGPHDAIGKFLMGN